MSKKAYTADMETETEVVLAEMNDDTTALAEIRGNFALGQISGDVTPDSLKLPRLQIAYGVGGLSENFTPGDLVLAGDNLLVHKGEPLRMIILTVTQYWKEYMSKEQRDSGAYPRIYITEQEVRENSGTTQWVNGVGPTFNRAMNFKLLIRKPDDITCGLFGIDIGEHTYAAAEWDVDKTAYRRVGPVVLSTAQFGLRTRGLISGLFMVSTKVEKVNSNNTVVPNIKLESHLTDSEVEQIKALFAPAA